MEHIDTLLEIQKILYNEVWLFFNLLKVKFLPNYIYFWMKLKIIFHIEFKNILKYIHKFLIQNIA